jgi:hypothetical protein
MSFVEDFQKVLLNPKEFFQEIEGDGFSNPLKFATVAIVITSLFSLGRVFALGGTESMTAAQLIGTQSGIAAFIGILVLSIVMSVANLFLGSSIDHIFVSLLGDDRYTKTFTAFAYGQAVGVVMSVVTLLLAVLPLEGSLMGILTGLITLALWIYMMYVIVRGISGLTRLSFGEAVLAVAIPVILIVIIIIAIYFLAIGMMTSQMGELSSMSTMQ